MGEHYDFDKEQLIKALDGLVDAWESLPGGRNYSPSQIADWLTREMKPAIDKARRVLGRKIPE